MLSLSLRNKVLGLFITSMLLMSCGNGSNDKPEPNLDDFNREEMLVNWSDNIIIPAYSNYVSKLGLFKEEAAKFTNQPTNANLELTREAWLEAYRAWQSVSMFEIGKAEALTIRNFTNIFPTDAAAIMKNIEAGNYNLELPSKNDEQGFPALDFLLNGVASDDESIVKVFEDTPAYGFYLNDVLERMLGLAEAVLNDWQGDFSASFISNDASSATSSVDKVINDYLFYYEKYLRAGKVGIPAGVFSSQVLPGNTEAFYHKGASKVLFLEGLDAVQNFFNGQAFSGNGNAPSLSSYLDFLDAQNGGEKLSTVINTQFDLARSKANALNDSFAMQVETDNSKMLQTYDELQKNVVLLKVDMLHALNVQVDFVDADGD